MLCIHHKNLGIKFLKKDNSFPRFFSLFPLSIFIFSFLFFPFSYGRLRAQEVKQRAQERLEIIDEEDKDSSPSSTGHYWDEHFNASFGASYSYGLDERSSRAYSYARLSWKDDFEWVIFNIEALIFRRDYRYALELNPDSASAVDRDIQALDAELQYPDTKPPMGPPNRSAQDICDSPSSPPSSPPSMRSAELEQLARKRAMLCENRESRGKRENFTLAVQDNGLYMREAHAKFNLRDDLQLLVGWNTIVWGQLDFLSPVDFLLPLRIGSAGLGITKADNRNAQLTGTFYYFPVPWVEIQAYFFPELGFDDAFVDTLIEGEEDEEGGAQRRDSPYVNVKKLELPTGSEAYRYAGRVLFYLDKLTLGLSYYQGYSQFDSNENLILERDTKNGEEIYRIQGENELLPVRSFGIESAYQRGKWSWKLDAVYFAGQEDLSLDVEDYNNQLLYYLPEDESFSKRKRYIEWILNKNDGKLEIQDNVFIATVGADADLEDWLLNLGVAVFFFQRSDKGSEGYSLYTEAEDVDEDFGANELMAAPIINVAYYTDKEKKDLLGLAAGFLNTGFGVILYTYQEYFESLRLGLALEYLMLFSNGIVNVEGYQIEDPAYPAIRFFIDYQL